ncbi:DJ-1 [Globomyces pollinis-pini]|nr:DJ-1 [Globomyces pollinis-pini]
MVSALVLIANGTEEMEAVISIDILRRANIEVTVAGVEGQDPVVCSRNVKIVPDIALESIKDTNSFDVLLLPGGLKGAQTFCSSPLVQKLIQQQYKSSKLLAVICAAPLSLKAANVHQQKQLTSHPSVKSQLDQDFEYLDQNVVVCENLVTARGPGTAFEFALKVVEILCGIERCQLVKSPL